MTDQKNWKPYPKELKATAKGRSNSMTKGRKTTWKERIEIVQDTLDNGKDYQQAEMVYQVS